MAEIKFTFWNAEWLNELFSGNPATFNPGDSKGYATKRLIRDRLRDLTGVINDVNSDIWVIVESPDKTVELQLFFDQVNVAGDWECLVQPSGAQSIGIAVRTDTGKFDHPSINWYDIDNSAEAEKLKLATNEFVMDVDADGVKELHKFERKPLYCSVNLKDGKKFRIIGLHLKSKGVFDALEWSKWWSKSDGNRKRIVAQCHQLRSQFLDDFLMDNLTKDIPLIVCGDINDGPGFDTSEMKIQSSGIERLMGSIWNPKLCLGNAVFDTLSVREKKELDFDSLYTTSFADPIFNYTYTKSWIDHILYNKVDRSWVVNAKIIKNMSNGNPIYKEFPTASDHMPVSCIIKSDII